MLMEPSSPSATVDVDERIRREKLELECELLRIQVSSRQQRLERIKVFAAASGFFVASVGMVGLFVSSYQWVRTARAQQEARVEDRIDHGLDQLNNGSPDARLAAVAALSGFIHRDSVHCEQILLAFAARLGFEESVVVRNAILASLDSLDARVSQPTLDDVARSLVQINQSLVVAGNLRAAKRTTPVAASPAEGRAISTMLAISTLLRKGARARNLDRTYLVGADLTTLDLRESSFQEALLSFAKFDDSNLGGSSFDRSYLDNASFVRSKLRGCVFSRNPLPLSHGHYGDVDGREWDYDVISAPLFDCADLTDARFDEVDLFAFPVSEYSRYLTSKISFRGAILNNTDFLHMEVFGIHSARYNANRARVFSGGGGGAAFRGDEPEFFNGFFGVSSKAADFDSSGAAKIFGEAFVAASSALEGSTWRNAKWPDVFRQGLTRVPPRAIKMDGCRN